MRRLACTTLVLPKRDIELSIECNHIVEMIHRFFFDMCDLKKYGVM